MTTLSERVAALHIQVSTPNEQLFGEVRGGDEVEIRFAGGYAERVGERELEMQLQRLARLMFAHRTAAYERTKRDVLDSAGVHREPKPQDAAYRAAYESMALSAKSSDGSVTISEVGLETWSFEIEDGAIARYGGERIARSVTEAANTLVASMKERVRELRHEFYNTH